MHTKNKSTHTRKRGGQPGNHNALYNAGGAPKQNQNAVKHGLLAKYLPKETLDIVMEVEESSPIDILYMNIKVQFARIIRAQKLMYVEGKIALMQEYVNGMSFKGVVSFIGYSKTQVQSYKKEALIELGQELTQIVPN